MVAHLHLERLGQSCQSGCGACWAHPAPAFACLQQLLLAGGFLCRSWACRHLRLLPMAPRILGTVTDIWPKQCHCIYADGSCGQSRWQVGIIIFAPATVYVGALTRWCGCPFDSCWRAPCQLLALWAGRLGLVLREGRFACLRHQTWEGQGGWPRRHALLEARVAPRSSEQLWRRQNSVAAWSHRRPGQRPKLNVGQLSCTTPSVPASSLLRLTGLPLAGLAPCPGAPRLRLSRERKLHPSSAAKNPRSHSATASAVALMIASALTSAGLRLI